MFDITDQHCLAGYSPVIIAISSPGASQLSSDITILFTARLLSPNEVFTAKDAIAMLRLKKIHGQVMDTGILSYYEAVDGSHRFVPAFHQLVTRLDNRLHNKKPGNVFLPGNRYTQVQIAYSVPRVISLITIGQNDKFNLFPTDLHGAAGAEHYIISLRHEGKACRQVETARQIALSQVDALACKTVYALGRNHMQELKSKEHFPFDPLASALYQLPLPEAMTSYRELALQESFLHGIHKLLLFKVTAQYQATGPSSTLAHIHNSYATWRYNNHLEGNYLFR